MRMIFKMLPMIDHIHITVEDIDRAERFYDKLLPLLGFDLSLKEYDAVPESSLYRNCKSKSGLQNGEDEQEKGGSLTPYCLSC